MFDQYLNEIRRALELGGATEHTHRPALKRLIETAARGVTATNEPKRVECGAPDLVLQRSHVPLGYIETKDVPISLDDEEASEQMDRYRGSLGNLILTNYLEFRWYVLGEKRLSAKIGTLERKGTIRRDKSGETDASALFKQFFAVRVRSISNSRELAARMAGLARLIRTILVNAYGSEPKDGALHSQLEAFKRVLISDLTGEQFSDMYAQTICYGLFAARCNHGAGEFTREKAAFDLPRTNPFLREIFSHMAGPDLDDRVTWAVDDLVALLDRADIKSILKDFGKQTGREDPVVHFYETFLAAYDPTLRETRGVYYTPEPVVSYIVRSVDHLLKSDFKLSSGLADVSTVRSKDESGRSIETPKVLILDPAAGTGTFLFYVINHIFEQETKKGQRGAWSAYVSRFLLPRLFGFELLMAPYAVCHMKLGLQLAETEYDFRANERLRVYLTNTLEEAHALSDLPLFAKAIAREAYEAGQIKQERPVMVVLGNPPYSGHSANKGVWITSLLRGGGHRLGDSKQANYFEVDGKSLSERNPKWLNDDYVKFIRFAQWRIERTGYGILAFVTNNGYLENPTFRGMRKALIDAFDDIYLLDLHGDANKRERSPDGSKDKNVFDIRQGVAIGIFVKKSSREGRGATVRHADLWGPREIIEQRSGQKKLVGGKYHWLSNQDVRSTRWRSVKPTAPYYFFVPREEAVRTEYESGVKITEAMPLNVLGFQSHRDHFAVGFRREEIFSRIADFRTSLSDAEIAERYNLENSSWDLRAARTALIRDQQWEERIIECDYRPLDRRWCYFSDVVMDRPRRELLDHVMGHDNLVLNVVRQTRMPSWQHAMVSCRPTPAVFVELKDGSNAFPLQLYSNGQKRDLLSLVESDFVYNFSRGFISEIAARTGFRLAPDSDWSRQAISARDVLAYIYAIFYSDNYRTRYYTFLRTDFPRVPITSKASLFRELSALGARLIDAHITLQCEIFTSFPVNGSNLIEVVSYTNPTKGGFGRVSINPAQYFDGISPVIWGFKFGGYQVCSKWLNDRRGRSLSYDEIQHYQRIVAVVANTLQLTSEIDATVSRHGGWPLN